MTISSTGNRASYSGNGVTVAFSFPYYFTANSDLVVVEQVVSTGVSTTLALGTNYTVTGAGVSTGGTVTRTVATATGTNISIVRAVPYTQGSSFPNNTAFDGPTTEAAWDRAVILAQQLKDSFDQSLHLPSTDVTNPGTTLPDLVTRAGKFLSFDSNGAISVTSPTAGTAGALAATLLASAGSSGVGFIQSGTGAVARTVQDKERDTISVFDFMTPAQIADVRSGALTLDVTVAVQAAMDASLSVYFPPGSYKTSAGLATRVEHHIVGAGMGVSIIVPTGAGIHGFVQPTSGTYTRCTISDLSISGGTTTGSGISFPTKLAYRTVLRNLEVIMGGDAFSLPTEFNTLLENCFASSTTGHGFFVQGGNTTTFINCYAVSVPTAAKYGYRCYGGATFISCNGIDAGPNWGCFGATVAIDGLNTVFDCTFIRCNIEAFTNIGLTFRFQGTARIDGGSFTKTSGTYDCCVRVEGNSCAIEVNGPQFLTSGGTRTKLAEFYATATNTPITFLNYTLTTIPGVDENGTLRTGRAYVAQQGTWTPVLRGSGVAGTQTYSAQTGVYVVTGDMVTAWFRITTSAIDAATTGNVQITGLPFTQTASESTSLVGGTISRWDGITVSGARTFLHCEIVGATSTIAILQDGSALGSIALPVTGLAPGSIWGMVTYAKT